MDWLSFLPVGASVLFSVATIPYVVRIVKAGASDQHSLATYGLMLAGNAAYLAWGLFSNAGWGFIFATGGASSLVVLEAGIVWTYRPRRIAIKSAPKAATVSLEGSSEDLKRLAALLQAHSEHLDDLAAGKVSA